MAVSLRVKLGFLLALMCCAGAPDALAQKAGKYGGDFLAGGVGARALGMGGAAVGLADDVTAGYRNPAGLAALEFPEFGYMHAERFAGVVSYDYASAALPLNARSTASLAIMRLGVDNIPNTLNAWDRDRNQPLPDAEDRISRFSYAHYAVFASYARSLGSRARLGASGKVVRGKIGDFADSWGYSFDVGVQYQLRRLRLGATLQDATRLLQTWSINPAAYDGAAESYQDFDLPEGGAEYTLPLLRLGAGYAFPTGKGGVLTAAYDMDIAFDGQRAYYIHAGDVSLHPRLGAEFAYRGVVALRAGVSQVLHSQRYGWEITPTVGAGLRLKHLSVDYAFGDFAGFTSDLGYSHRISLQYKLARERWKRPAH